MPKIIKLKISQSKRIKKNFHFLSFSSSYLAKIAQPGNFLHLKVPPLILRRPFSIHKIEDRNISILFKIKGKGTTILSRFKKGDFLEAIAPLGNSFSFPSLKEKVIIVGGGIGVAPLVFLANLLKSKGISPLVLLGAKTKEEILCPGEFKKLKLPLLIATDDGSKGKKGSVVSLLVETIARLKNKRVRIFACGPYKMYEAIKKIIQNKPHIEAEASFEQFMGCGLGFCCGCVIETKGGYKKVCKDGAIFNLKEIM